MIVPDTKWVPTLTGAGRSKYKALAQAIRDGIAGGHLPPEARLPAVRDLAFRVGVTPGTVARAYKQLVDEGRLVAGVGRGTFVAGTRHRSQAPDDPLIFHVDEDHADFRSSRVPDVGQGVIIDAALIKVGQSHRRRHINYPTAETDRAARAAVARWIDPNRIGQIGAEDIVLGNGAQNCCILALQAVLRGNRPVILTEDLGYPGVRHAARLLRAEAVGVEMDGEGIVPEALEQAYRQHGGQVLLTAPGIHSPTTIRTGLRRRQEIAALCRKLGLRIIEDDCYDMGAADLPTYRALTDGQAYYVSSLTKSVSGALRFGFMVSAAGQEERLRQVAQSSFYGVSQPILDVCEELLISGAAAEIRSRVETHIAARVRQTVNRLGAWDILWREEAPFIWLQMPTGWRASRFAMACEKRGVMLRPADEFALADGKAPNAVRLALSTCNDDALFARALRQINDLLAHPQGLIEA